MFTPFYDTPQQRIADLGASALSAAELIALVVQASPGQSAMQIAEALLAQCGGLTGLGRASLFDLAQVPGIGQAKAARLRSAVELGRRLCSATDEKRPQISSPADAARLLMPEMSALEQEHMRVVLLDTRHRLLGIHEVYKGSLNVSMVRVGEVFREAIRRNCAAIIVAHNHPSGDASPSSEDAGINVQLVEAGNLLDIPVLDHIVVGSGGHWVSMKERGLGFK
jgi:DNA repair protein RadC